MDARGPMTEQSYVRRHASSPPALHPPAAYDYTRPGAYSVTLCTLNRECLFGEIVNDEMILNEAGLLAQSEWLRSGEIRRPTSRLATSAA